MSSQVTITATLSSIFNAEKFESFLLEHRAKQKAATDQYILKQWDLDGINITLYSRKLVIQGKHDNHHTGLLLDVCKFDGLILSPDNKQILSMLRPKRQNAILCDKCTHGSLLVAAEIEGLEIKFKKECDHIENLNAPFHMINNRILPDLSILVSKSLSRLVDLGYFKGFEVLIPQIAMNIIDSTRRSPAVSEEIEALKEYESKNIISVRSFEDNSKIGDEDYKREDDIMIEISDTTNSILLTADDNMKAKCLLKNRPVIFFDRKSRENIKTFHDLRSNTSPMT